jgi:hypothetical protein
VRSVVNFSFAGSVVAAILSVSARLGRAVLRTGFFDEMPAFYLRVIETSQLNPSVRSSSYSLQRNHNDECS